MGSPSQTTRSWPQLQDACRTLMAANLPRVSLGPQRDRHSEAAPRPPNSGYDEPVLESRLSEEALALLDALPECCAIVDEQQRVVALNAAWRQKQAASPHAAAFAVGRPYAEADSPDLGPGAADLPLIAAALAGRGEQAQRTVGDPHSQRWLRTFALPWNVSSSPLSSASSRLPHGRYVLVRKEDVTDRMQAEQTLGSHRDILRAVAAVAERLLSDADWTAQIRTVLALLGQATQVSRVYVFDARPTPDGDYLSSQLYEWCAPGVSPQIDNPDLQNLPFRGAGLGRWVDELSANRPIFGLVDSMPDGERAILEPQGILSLIVLPIFMLGRFWGFMGFDECHTRRTWLVQEIDALHAATRLLGSAMSHSHTQQLEQEGKAHRARLQQQEEALRELSAPLIPVTDTVLVMPLIGSLDRDRIEYVTESLLAGATSRRARRVILDVTGVRRLDPDAAAGLVRVTQAARLLGLEILLTGVRADMARLLIDLGSALLELPVRSTLQAGIAQALAESAPSAARAR